MRRSCPRRSPSSRRGRRSPPPRRVRQRARGRGALEAGQRPWRACGDRATRGRRRARAEASLRGRSSSFDPAERALVTSPGTANTSRPSSSAKSAVISAPDRSLASTTTTASERPATIRFLAGEPPRRLRAGRVLGRDQSIAGDALRQLGVGTWVVPVDPAARGPPGRPAHVERAAMRLAVDSTREPAHDDEARRGQLAPEPSRDLPSVRAARPCSDNCDGRRAERSTLVPRR